MLQPIWNDAIELMVLNGTLEADEFFSDIESEFAEAEWTPQAWDWVDPEREAIATGILIDRNIYSKTRVAAGKGVVFRDEIEQIKKDRDAQEALDLDPDAGSSDKGMSMPDEEESNSPPSGNGKSNARTRIRWGVGNQSLEIER